MTNAITQYEPSDISSGYDLAKILFDSGCVPKSLKSPAAVFMVMQAGRELGLPTVQSLRSIGFENGKLSTSSDLMGALCLQSSKCELFECVVSTGTSCTYVAKRVGKDKRSLTWTLEMAKEAGLLSKDPWKKYPDAMLRARAQAAIARMVFPDIVMGMYDADEIAPAPQSIPSVKWSQSDAEPVDDSFLAMAPAPTPPALDGGSVWDRLLRQYETSLANCATLAALDDLGAEAAAEGFQGDVRAKVLEMFAVRRKEMA